MSKCVCHGRMFKNKKALSNHLRWLNGSMDSVNWKGRTHEGTKGINKGSKNGMWKGNKKLHTISLHEWVNNNIGREKECEVCGDNRNIDLANITEKYERDLENWKYMCRKCHMTSDGRINNLKQFIREEMLYG